MLLLLIAVSVVFWVEYQMRDFRGQFVEVIESNDIQAVSGLIMIQNVSVLNPEGTDMIPNQDVLIKGEVIVQIGQGLSTPTEATRIDGSGQFLIPGLMDGHVHITHNPNTMWLNLVNGVTHLRDMGGSDYHVALKAKDNRHALWPDMFVTSEKVYSSEWYSAWFMEWTRTRLAITSEAAADGLIQDLKSGGFDGVKISGGLTAAHYQALVKAANKESMLLLGHLPDSVDLDTLLQSGQHEIAHVEEITKALSREFGGMHAGNAEAYLDHVRKRSTAVAKTIKDNDIKVTSVIWLIESLKKQKFDHEAFLKTVAISYIAPTQLEGTALTRGWLPGNHSYASDPSWFATAETRQQLAVFWDTYVEAIHIMTRALMAADVDVMAGTDAITSGAVPGFSLHDELQSLVNIGLTPSQALRSATSTPGKWYQSIDGMGSAPTGMVKLGHKANLLLLNKNPLKDIKNTQSIESVIIRGQLLNRSQLDTILKRIQDGNNQNRNQDISAYLN